MQAGGRQAGRQAAFGTLGGDCGDASRREDTAFPVEELIRNVEGLLQWGKGQLCTTVRQYDTRGLPVEPLADVTTTDTLQTPTAQILHTKEAFRSRTLPTPHHSLRLSYY
jgi:hypothetical protein